ncbi:MAG: TetR/AcrR family transcriptional regulator [Gemmatimonadetes bacterium]|nr:TetR/AcrR family transcriptional regulator [Gemmatimonadota bacterium]
MNARRAAFEETRARIVAAARELLSAPGGIEAFTIDRVAARAGVARMTVYYQFGSKAGLVEAVFDSLEMIRTGVPRLIAALALDDDEAALAEFIRIAAEAWQADRLVIRRLRGLAALDPAFAEAWRAREGRRRDGLRRLAARVAEHRPTRDLDVDAATAALSAIVSPESFEAMAGDERDSAAVRPIVHQLARKALGLDAGEPLRFPPAKTD